ncbi:MAG: glycosyltransferase family 39 protein [Muribaculaceae bacterium]|nr:glycosyltransferase family 39 protein [Muribaculaceae bacterium]
MRRSAGISFNGATLVLAGLLLVTFAAFLGQTLFYSKGEPREAVVAVSMLQQGNWILPVSVGADIPYKPPMLAWIIAALGWLNGGHVTEFLSRLPSALAATAMILCVFRFYCRRTTVGLGVLTAFVTMTAFEVHRAATSCRVDMLLCCFTVLAILAMARHWERQPGRWTLPWTGILLMSLGVLTKGPVGMLIPCLVVGAWRLAQRDPFWHTLLTLALSGVLSLVVPALWYAAAYAQGGDEFLRLAMEENFGRFTGQMSYDSHKNGLWYYFAMLPAGMAPWTLLALLSLFAWRKFRYGILKLKWRDLVNDDPAGLLALCACVIVFVFYCVPQSKRGVYLLPMYPFLAYWLAFYMRWLADKTTRVLKAFGWIVALLGTLVSAVLLCALFGWLPDIPGREAVDASLAELRVLGARFAAPMACCLCFLVCLSTIKIMARGDNRQIVQWTMIDVMVVYWMFSAAIQPAALNPRSDYRLARAVADRALPGEPVYSYADDRMMRFYQVNFYTGDGLTVLDSASVAREVPSQGLVLVARRDSAAFARMLPADLPRHVVTRWAERSSDLRSPVLVYRLNPLTL